MATILLSKHLGTTRKKLEKIGVYDVTLGIDTKLFVDPKQLVSSDIPEFKDSRENILKYFRKLIKVHKQSHKVPRLLDIARDMLAVKEPQGLSIGYGNKHDKGTAIPKSVANQILLSLSEILSVGIEDPEVVELLGLFVSGFGPDSISDLTASIIYPQFCVYTERIAKELATETQVYEIDGVKYNLPKHPYLETPAIAVPSDFLQPLPIALDWDGIAMAAEHNENLRGAFNEILRPVIEETLTDADQKSSGELIDFKKSVEKLVSIYRAIQVQPYNLKSDIAGFYGLKPYADSQTDLFTPTKSPKTQRELLHATKELLTQFKRGIEDNGANKLLYRKTKTGVIIQENPHKEEVLQTLFYLVADQYCERANIALNGESNAGRGPVDFSLSIGYDKKVLVETKKSDNKELLNGFVKQVEAYERSEKAFISYFVVAVVKKTNPKKESQLDRVKKLYETKKKNSEKCPELFIVDGLIHPSPSKLR